MSIVKQPNKKTGVIYVYESVAYWDKEKKQARAKRKLIGILDPITQEVVPTKKRNKANKEENISKDSRYFYGATYLFDKIAENIGLSKDLENCFGKDYKKILSIAYYLVLEDKNTLSRFNKWASLHKHPANNSMSSQRISELFSSITEDTKNRFFRLQAKRRVEKEYIAYDTTSISSYSKCLNQIKYGVNKEHDMLAQINLALLFGQESNLPFYYRKLSGNIPDVVTVKKLLSDMSFLGFDKVKLVMDRGFYSFSNINSLYKNHLKFLIAGKLSLKIVQDAIDSIRQDITQWQYYSSDYNLYAKSLPIAWHYSLKRPYKKDELKEEKRMYMHIYYSKERAIDKENAFNMFLSTLKEELLSKDIKKEHQKQYEKYFEVSANKSIKITPKEDSIADTMKNYGFFVLLSNDIKDPIEALEIYRNKDLVEKAFGDLKERLNFRRLLVSSEQSLDGKLFVEFIALIILSYIKKKMQEAKLFKNYTMQELLDEFDIIECFEQPNKKLYIGEITQKQIQLYEMLGVKPPISLQ
ncbi:IS1634 family transposase [Desulfurella sp.]|uniref:IS1634 family transposase n=1 Tax=Desulfurella sp. TaxID=1962857 RepID=UPI0025B9EA23|nr:IS1634 family transposase [Desulfurella sp.]